MLQLLLKYILFRHGASTRMWHQGIRSARVAPLVLLLSPSPTHQLVVSEQMFIGEREVALFTRVGHVTAAPWSVAMVIVRLHMFVQIALERELLVTVLAYELLLQHVFQMNRLDVNVHLTDPGELHGAELTVVRHTRVCHLLVRTEMYHLC